jgi:hypothetical protein
MYFKFSAFERIKARNSDFFLDEGAKNACDVQNPVISNAQREILLPVRRERFLPLVEMTAIFLGVLGALAGYFFNRFCKNLIFKTKRRTSCVADKRF